MLEFLKKFLSAEEIKVIQDKYIAANPGATSLPTYISKARLDEVLGQKKTLEDENTGFKTQIETLQKSNQAAVDAAVKQATDALKAENDTAIGNLKKDYESKEAIMQAHGKNMVAIQALMDPTKAPADEIARLQKSDPYLFGTDIPGGTGKAGGDGGSGKGAETLEAMRRAVGV